MTLCLRVTMTKPTLNASTIRMHVDHRQGLKRAGDAVSFVLFLGALSFNLLGKGQGGGQGGSTTSRSRTVDRIWFSKFSRHDLHRSHAMYEEIKKKKH